MKIIEAMKEMPLIIKKIEANNSKIGAYASTLSTVTDHPFGSIENQKKEVSSLVQSNEDLVKRYLMLQRSLAYTNTQVKVAVNGEVKTITEWLHIRNAGNISSNGLHGAMLATYNSLNTSVANGMLRNITADLSETTLQVIRCYEQKKADENIERLTDMYDGIDAQLEVTNATTDLIEI